MKINFFLILSVITLINCKEKQQQSPQFDNKIEDFVVVQIPDTTVEIGKLVFDRKVSKFSLNGMFYSGYAIRKNSANLIVEKAAMYNGMKHNESIEWFNDGELKNVSNFYQGKLHGERKMWGSDSTHILIAHNNFDKGQAHGIQKKWYPTGELFTIQNYKNGREEGIQKAYRKNGVLYANYEAKNGRTFGLKKASLCFGLEDQKIKNDK